MSQTISKKQFTRNQKQAKADRRQAKRERERSRQGHATGYKPYRETAAAKLTGYRVVRQELPWKGSVNEKTGKAEALKGEGQGQSRVSFFLHPVTNVPIWHSSPPSEVAVVRYILESTSPLANLPHCPSPQPSFGVGV